MKVSLFSIPNDREFKGDGSETEFKSYLNFPATLGQKYDLILDDGRARVDVRWEGRGGEGRRKREGREREEGEYKSECK